MPAPAKVAGKADGYNITAVERALDVLDAFRTHGGELTRLAVQRAAPVGGFLAWRPMMPVTQWVVWK